MTFDISLLAAKDTAEIPLNSPKGKPLLDAAGKPLSVTIHGPGSKVYSAAQADRNQRLLDRMATKGRQHVMTPEEQLQDQAEFLTAITVSFNGFGYQGAADAAAMKLAYADARMGWMTEQVARGAGDWANFCSGSATS